MLNNWVIISLFILFLWPITIGEYSVNYSFALFAAVVAAQKLYMPGRYLLGMIILFTAGFVFSVSLNLLGPGDYAYRMLVSFLIFITMFAFSGVRIAQKEVICFKVALVAISCLFALKGLFTFFLAGGNELGWAQKNIVGSQRFGFIYLLGLFVLLYCPARTVPLKAAKFTALFLIGSGILLTFSRSTVVSLAGVAGLYTLVAAFQRDTWRPQGIQNAGKGLVQTAVLTVALFLVLPVTFDFYVGRIIERYGPVLTHTFISEYPAPRSHLPSGQPDVAVAGPQSLDDILDRAGSEGTRLTIWTAILKHTLAHPFLGSGYLGSWILSDVKTGSAHNQYLDVMLRVGFVSFAAFLVLLYKVFRVLWSKHADLFWGGIGVLIYGIFHETFKESQGAFVLAFLIGIYANYLRSEMQEGLPLLDFLCGKFRRSNRPGRKI